MDRPVPVSGVDRRRERRIAVELPGSLLIAGETEQRIWYSNISANGCRVTGVECQIRVGAVVEVGLGPVGFNRATVRWITDAAIGVQFHVELHPALVTYFDAFLANSV